MAALLFVALWRLCWDILMENDNAQFLLARLIAGFFCLGNALVQDGAVGDGSLEFGSVDYSCVNDSSISGNMNFNTYLPLFRNISVNIIYSFTGAIAVADAASVAAALARAEAGAGARADAGA